MIVPRHHGDTTDIDAVVVGPEPVPPESSLCAVRGALSCSTKRLVGCGGTVSKVKLKPAFTPRHRSCAGKCVHSPTPGNGRQRQPSTPRLRHPGPHPRQSRGSQAWPPPLGGRHAACVKSHHASSPGRRKGSRCGRGGGGAGPSPESTLCRRVTHGHKRYPPHPARPSLTSRFRTQ